jgi:hypothetical protein
MYADPKGIGEDAIGLPKVSDHTKGARLRSEWIEAGLPDEVSCKEHPRLNFSLL